jgi:hypothetical protein
MEETAFSSYGAGAELVDVKRLSEQEKNEIHDTLNKG